MTSVNELVKLLQGLKTVSAPKKKNRKRKSKKNAGSGAMIPMPAAMMLPASSTSSKKRKRRGKGGSMLSEEGVIRLKKRELLVSITTKDGLATKVDPVADSTKSVLPFLAKIGKSFDRIIWHSVTVEYRPTVGTARDGSFSMGIDWGGGETVPGSKGAVLALSPNSDGAVYQPQVLRASQARLMSKNSYNLAESGTSEYPFTLKTWLSDQMTAGDIWLTYDVTLMGTQ